ncbi:MAG: hypothetical protein Q4F54_01805 [Coriobacteriia bacterium]|nr:hypothetical protein [Coriobacteriia bacterium]
MKEVYRYLSHAYNDGIGMHMISELLDPLTFASGGTTDGKQARIIDRLDLNITDNNKNLFEPE